LNKVNISAVLFDWGGVFQRTLDYKPRQELALALGLSESELERGVFDSPAMREASLGKLPAVEAWQRSLAALGYSGDIYEFATRFFMGDRIDQRLVALVRYLREHGNRVGLLSNAPPPLSTARGVAARWGADNLFDVELFSYQTGVLKPDPLAFTAALNRLGVEAQRTIFIDDTPANVQGARAIGLNALLFQDVGHLLTDLKNLGLDVPCPDDLL